MRQKAVYSSINGNSPKHRYSSLGGAGAQIMNNDF